MNANPELLVLPLVLPEQRRTRDPLPEALVRQFLRRRPQMDLHLTDEQVALLVAELDRMIDGDRYPLSVRIAARDPLALKALPATPADAGAAEVIRAAEQGSVSETQVKPYAGPLTPLGNAATAKVRLIV